MVIELTGVNTWNKGAELMLVAILNHVRSSYPDVQFVVDQYFGTHEERARYGLGLKAMLPTFSRSALAVSLMPESFRRAAGLVRGSDVDAVVDASGFAFSDQLPVKRIAAFAEFVESRRNRPLILMPQALGPFEKMEHRDAFRKIAQHATLIFARDEVSLEYARQAARNSDNLRLAPDFTNLVKPSSSSQTDDGNLVYVVPNQRMIEKASSDQAADAYLPTLQTCIAAVRRARYRPILLVHGRNDLALVDQIQRTVEQSLEVVQEDDPVEIKRILGNGKLVIGSRFHALVSALSHGVPCIATSWSHKYEMLFREYGCEDMILNVPAEPLRIEACVQKALGADREHLILQLHRNAARLEGAVEQMWQEVYAALGFPPTSRDNQKQASGANIRRPEPIGAEAAGSQR